MRDQSGNILITELLPWIRHSKYLSSIMLWQVEMYFPLLDWQFLAKTGRVSRRGLFQHPSSVIHLSSDARLNE
jgi:hypothetical protein